jgi:hypothetical protein
MQKSVASIITSLLFIVLSNTANASPWFTGPLLAPAGRTVPRGHANFEAYGFSTDKSRVFDNHGKKRSVPDFNSTQISPILTYGLINGIDVQWSLPYSINRSQLHTGQNIGDTSITMGFQALQQKQGSWIPDLRITVQELFPTGRGENLNPFDFGVDVTGSGTYQTVAALNFQELFQLSELHYLRTRLSLAYLHGQPYSMDDPHDITLDKPKGVVKPGSLMSIDCAGEYTFDQNWVGVMEVYAFYHTSSSFAGNAGIDENGQLIQTGHDPLYNVSIAPAVEYNFTQQYGLIAGPWFVVYGKNSSVFTSLVVAFNAYW